MGGMLSSRGRPQFPKRLFDLITGSLLLIAAAPLMLAVALIILSCTGRPVLFRQNRVGRSGQTFVILKFRTMVVDETRSGSFSTAVNDPRITGVGQVLRRWSLDELPQLLNVVRGDMSLVGPRPDVPEQRALYSDDEWELRHSVRPGITGLAQARFRSTVTEEVRKELDLRYAVKPSVAWDIAILAGTVKQLFKNTGN